jgi:ATP-dependent DNA helicase RecG
MVTADRAGAEHALDPMSPVRVLPGIGSTTAERLRQAGIATLLDLLRWFPRRYRELRELATPAETWIGDLVRLSGTVFSARRAFLPGRRSMVTIRFACADGSQFDAAFFNQPWLLKAYAVGEARSCEGVLARKGERFVLQQARILPKAAEPRGDVQLRYPEIEGVASARLVAWLRAAIERIDPTAIVLPPLPTSLAEFAPPPATLLRAMHQPADVAEHERARTCFAVREAVALFAEVERARAARAARPARTFAVDAELGARILARIPLQLTADQATAVRELWRRLAGPSAAGVLLQGDVGTGKTAVAMAAALAVVARGGTVAFLLPTELLAEQQHRVACAWLAGSSVVPMLRTAAHTEGELAPGQLVFGTHALLAEDVVLPALGLVIVDEQHRFGVKQRAALVQKGDNPHVLVMTATPIPRTLTFALFGDLEVATLRQRPPGRLPVPARHVAAADWARAVQSIARAIRRGGRVFVVCPAIGDEGEKGGVVRMLHALQRQFRCGSVHGRLQAAARARVLAEFRAGSIDVLVGTTVLEVGVDVPEATLMVVAAADRFGIATLHQLRGRVGRGQRRGLCLLCGPRTARIEAVCRTTDGFALAEADLQLRGSGELMGSAQSGFGDLRALDPIADADLLQRVRTAVRQTATEPAAVPAAAEPRGVEPRGVEPKAVEPKAAARAPGSPRAVSVAEARAIDVDATRRLGMPTLLLMENAARAVAAAARELGERFVVLAGPGNNGGDGLAAARHLGFARCRIHLTAEPDPARSPDAALQAQILRAAGAQIVVGRPPPEPFAEAAAAVWIDALWGTGLSRPLDAESQRWVAAFNKAPGQKLCVDIPSGLHGDSGEVLGACCRGDVTVTFVAPKLGMLTPTGQAHCGRIVIAGLGLP